MSLLCAARLPRSAALMTRYSHHACVIGPSISRQYVPKFVSTKIAAWRSSRTRLAFSNGASLARILRVGVPLTVLGRGFRTAVHRGRSVVTRCKHRMHSVKSGKQWGKELPPGAAAEEAGATAAAGETAATAEPEQMTIKLMWQRYGAVAVGTHFGVYFTTVAALYAAVDQGLLGSTPEEKKEAIAKVADKMEPYVPEFAISSIRSSPAIGAFAVAWLSAKFTEPFRLVLTIFLVPKIARYMGRAPSLSPVAKAKDTVGAAAGALGALAKKQAK